MITRYLLTIAIMAFEGSEMRQEIVLKEFSKKENCQKELIATRKNYPSAKCVTKHYLFPTDDQDLESGKKIIVTNGYYKGKKGTIKSSTDTDNPRVRSYTVQLDGIDFEQYYTSEEVAIVEEEK